MDFYLELKEWLNLKGWLCSLMEDQYWGHLSELLPQAFAELVFEVPVDLPADFASTPYVLLLRHMPYSSMQWSYRSQIV